MFILFSLGMAPFSQPVTAAGTIVVTTTLDAISNDGLCSLREAVIAANTNAESSNCPAGSPGEDTIVFDASISLPAVFTLTLTGQNENYAASGDLDVRESLIITAPAPPTPYSMETQLIEFLRCTLGRVRSIN